jgi:hypothetical protein
MTTREWDLESARLGAVAIASGISVNWHEPGYPSYEHDLPHAFATVEVVAIAGAAEMGSDASGQPSWQTVRAAAGSLATSAALMPGCEGLELRYCSQPESGRARIRMFVTAKARAWNVEVAHAVLNAACSSLPRGFQCAEPVKGPAFGDETPAEPIVELRRVEELTYPQWDYIPADFYYTIPDVPGDGSGWARFWDVLGHATGMATVSILFKPSELHPIENNVIGALTTDLDALGEVRTDYDAFGNQISVPACMNARLARDSWLARRERLQRPLLARVAVKGSPSTTVPIATALATALSATASGGIATPMTVEAARSPSDERQARFSFDWLDVLPWGGHQIWEHEAAPVTLRRLPYLYGAAEAASLAILPVPDEQGVPGFPRARRTSVRRASVADATDDGPGLLLGDLQHHGTSAGTIQLPLSAINRHVLVVGAPSSGKTTTVLSLLADLWRTQSIPFLAIEPKKTEYRSLLSAPGMDKLQIISLGRDDVSPLRLNPLAPPAGVRRETHAGAVLATLKLAMPLLPPLPQLLEAALDQTYEVAGWDYDTTSETGIPAPTLRALLQNFNRVFHDEGYVGEAKNVGTAFGVRLKSLLSGTKGRVFDTVESCDFAALMELPTVIELDQVVDPEEKSIMAAFVLDRIRAAADARRSSGGQLKHVTVIEEAHRLLPRLPERSDGGSDPRAQAALAFADAIAELRARGEGFVVCSQRPSELAERAVANTGTRIIHRLESADDRKSVLDDLDASTQDREVAARLRQGEAVVRWPERDEAEIVKVRAAPGIDSGRDVSDDIVKAHMADTTRATRKLLPYGLCTRDVCVGGCDPAVRREGHLTANQFGRPARKRWDAHASNTIEALPEIAELLVNEADGDIPRAYCGAVHISVNGDALNPKRGRDIRPKIVEAIRKQSLRP